MSQRKAVKSYGLDKLFIRPNIAKNWNIAKAAAAMVLEDDKGIKVDLTKLEDRLTLYDDGTAILRIDSQDLQCYMLIKPTDWQIKTVTYS